MAYPLFLNKLLVRSGIAPFLPWYQRWTKGGAAYLRHVSDRVLAAPLQDLLDTAAFAEWRGPDAIDLALSSPCFDLVPSGSTKLPADRRGAPPIQGLPELREAVAARLRNHHQIAVQPTEEVLITPGAAGAWNVTADTFINSGDRVVLFDPTSPLFILTLRQRRARLRWVSTWLDNGRTRFRLDHLDRALRGARLLVLNSPANPTGGVFAPEELEQIAWWAERRDVLIYSDEVFERYWYEGSPLSVGALPKARRRTLTAGSVSNGFALASARVGWLAGNRHLVRNCAVNTMVQTASVSTICQQIATTALQQPEQTFQPIHAEFASRRQYVYERLQSLGLKPVWPAGAYFFWLPVHDLGFSGRSFAAQLMRTKNVRVTPGHRFGPSGGGHVRVSYAAEDGRLREGLSRLAEMLRKEKPAKVAQAA